MTYQVEIKLNENDVVNCHICNENSLKYFNEYPILPRVASDCTSWPPGGKLAVCMKCHCVQNPVDTDWEKQTNAIYNRYDIYQQSAGMEQSFFMGDNYAESRSSKIFNKLGSIKKIGEEGRLLDIGCANGALLREFNRVAPKWKLVGFEIDDKRKKEVESIPSVESFFSGSIEKIDSQFDIITLIHVFEHLAYPEKWLRNLGKLLKPNGFIIIQVPDPMKNPYNLLVADHCSHFLLKDLRNIAVRSGYHVIIESDNWISREFTMIIQQKNVELTNSENIGDLGHFNKVSEQKYPLKSIEWLDMLIDKAKSLRAKKPLGIWGTAIAATWFASLVDFEPDFFVDEDPNRIGEQHLDKPIYSPEEIPQGSYLFIALTPDIAKNIIKRWSHLDIELEGPPELNY